jgi:adenylylsulfate kinase
VSAGLAPHDAGFTVWLTGLKGSGKGAVARLVAAELARHGLRTELLAGGDFRQNISRGLGFSREDRVANIRRIGYVAQLLTRNGVAVVTTSISPYRDARDECRRMIGRFVEVFCDAPLEACEARDGEGLYRRARAGLIDDFTGISDPYEPPPDPEVTLHTDREPPEASAARVLRRLEELGYLAPARSGDPDEALVRAQLKALQNR